MLFEFEENDGGDGGFVCIRGCAPSTCDGEGKTLKTYKKLGGKTHRIMISKLLHWAWRAFPLDPARKQRIKRRLLEAFRWRFKPSETYETWMSLRDAASGAPFPESTDSDNKPVPLLEAAPLKAPPVRLIAFYLPQFHPIPENDAWWERGFTEWTNVVRGKPQFKEHYQPHLPGELGFYDLRLVEVQERQVELARLYGIGGFAFYFYWFGGKRLLERPLRQYLENNRLGLPFCLCWANESWSRRWDGRDKDLLVTQLHSPADDQAFIAYISEYLNDPRYIRVNGRPLLILYRPDLLPDASGTAQRWRAWCRENGVGELYLACTQSFQAVDPTSFGFDAAIEFPPNGMNAPIITDDLELLNPDFNGIVYDWRAFPAQSRHYRAPAYRLFRGVNPGWDNEARRRGGGGIYFRSSPSGYREWLSNAVRDSIARFANPDERLVFVNAWNEWAEGAHLEPDQKHGYAYLQATRDALTREH